MIILLLLNVLQYQKRDTPMLQLTFAIAVGVVGVLTTLRAAYEQDRDHHEIIGWQRSHDEIQKQLLTAHLKNAESSASLREFLANSVSIYDELQKNSLIKRFPHGYAIVAVTQKTKDVVFAETQFDERFRVRWETARILELSNESYRLCIPTIETKSGLCLCQACEWSDTRHNYRMTCLLRIAGYYRIKFGVLANFKNDLFAVIGITGDSREPDDSPVGLVNIDVVAPDLRAILVG